jgi:hypothetical protein
VLTPQSKATGTIGIRVPVALAELIFKLSFVQEPAKAAVVPALLRTKLLKSNLKKKVK